MGLKSNLTYKVHDTSNEGVLDASKSSCKLHNRSNGRVIDAFPKKIASKYN